METGLKTGTGFPFVSPVALERVVAAAKHLEIFGHGLAALRPWYYVVTLHLFVLEMLSAYGTNAFLRSLVHIDKPLQFQLLEVLREVLEKLALARIVVVAQKTYFGICEFEAYRSGGWKQNMVE